MIDGLTESENRLFCNLWGGESADLDELLSSCLVYILHIAYCVPITLVLVHSTFATLTLTFPMPLLCGGATLLCYRTDWFWYIILTVQCWLNW